MSGAEFFIIGPPELREVGPAEIRQAEAHGRGDGGGGGVESV